MFHHQHYIACKWAHMRAEQVGASQCPECDRFFIRGTLLLRHLKEKGNEACWKKWESCVQKSDRGPVDPLGAELKGSLKTKEEGKAVNEKGKGQKRSSREKAYPREIVQRRQKIDAEPISGSLEAWNAPTALKNPASDTGEGYRNTWTFDSQQVHIAGLLPPQLREPREPTRGKENDG
jgi:hypothetical protein